MSQNDRMERWSPRAATIVGGRAAVGYRRGLALSVVVSAGLLLLGVFQAAQVDADGRHTASRAASHAGVSNQLDASPLVYLPLLLARTNIDQLPTVEPLPPSPTPTRTPPFTATPSATPTPTATYGPTPTATPPTCSQPLESRLVTTYIQVDGTIETGAMGQWTRYPMFMDARPDGSALVGWSSTRDEVHFTPVDSRGARAGSDLVVDGDSIHGLVAHEGGGGAALIARPDDMHLVRFDADGTVVFDELLVGDTPKGQEGSKWIDSWGYEGRLRWTGSAYAAYFGHTGYFGVNGKHQGDLLWLFDEDGQQLTYEQMPQYPQWDWGCSHSLDVRLIHNPESDTLGPMCLSDGYPSPGFIFRHATQIGDPVSADGHGRADGYLGGIVPAGAGFAVTYGTESGRRSYDIALSLISEFGYSLRDYWLTDTPSVDEEGPHLASYGEHFLAGWESGRDLMLAVVNLDGELVEGPVAVQSGLAEQDDFINFFGGDAGWAAAGSGGNLMLVRVPVCR